MTATLMSNLKYFTTKHSMAKAVGKSVDFLTIWIIADLEINSGCELLKNALNYMVSVNSLNKFVIINFQLYINIISQ